MSCYRVGTVALLLLAFHNAQAAAAVTKQQVVGIWACGPTVMKGTEATVTATYVMERRADLTYVGRGSTVVEPKGAEPFIFETSSRGNWRLDGDILISTNGKTTFLSTSKPGVTVEMGQKIMDEEDRKAPVSRSRVLHIDSSSMSKISVGSLYREAQVPSHCKRKS